MIVNMFLAYFFSKIILYFAVHKAVLRSPFFLFKSFIFMSKRIEEKKTLSLKALDKDY